MMFGPLIEHLYCEVCGKLAEDLDDDNAYCECGEEWGLPFPSESYHEVTLATIKELEEDRASMVKQYIRGASR